MPVTPDEFLANPFDAEFGQHGNVPAYTAEGMSIDDIAADPELGLPITEWRQANDGGWLGVRRRQLVCMFHDAIQSGNTELVMTMVQRGIVSPDVRDLKGLSALGRAIGDGNTFMTKLLLDLGAQVNLPMDLTTSPPTQRTPLMLAAEKGHLVIVKLLMDSGADDGIIAPDGQMALRLAVDNGYREVVDFLPTRRGGAFLRWKAHNAKAFHRIKSAVKALYYFVKFFVWHVPKFLVWTLPKGILKGLSWLAKWTWKKICKAGGWLKSQIKSMPARLRKAAHWVLRGIKRIPGVLASGAKAVAEWLKAGAKVAWSAIKAMPSVMAHLAKRAGMGVWRAGAWCGHQIMAMPGRAKRASVAVWNGAKIVAIGSAKFSVHIAKCLWRGIKAISSGLAVVWGWLVKTSTTIGKALAALLLRPISLLHTAAMTVVSAIKGLRNVTLTDLWYAIKAVGAAIVDLPRQVWNSIKALGEVSFDVLTKIFGCVGLVVYLIGFLVVKIVIWIPEHLLEILAATLSSFKKGGRELAVVINPKW